MLEIQFMGGCADASHTCVDFKGTHNIENKLIKIITVRNIQNLPHLDI
jgi:hypothetical protein